MFLLYRFLINLVCFLSPIIIIFRILKKKEDIKRFKEKFSITNLKRPKGNLIWFHACSVGELKSIVPLIINFEKNKNVNNILITTSTLSSSKVFTKLNFKKTIHQFFPIDSWYLTNKFLDQWKPNKVIFVESEIWPNMLMNIKRRKIPSILLNARITKKTFFRWKKINSFSNKIFQIFDKIFPQSKETRNFLNILGIKNTKIIGNLKYCDNSLTKIKNISF
jgi:3-deoxy-D-manno-octulosonic-acid transferase